MASLESADRDTDGYAADADVFPGVCCDNKLAFSAIIQRDSLPSVDPPPAGDIRSSIAVVRQGRPDRPRSYSAPFSLPVIDTLSHRSCTRPVVRELYVYLETESSALLPNRTSLFLGLVVCTSKCALGSVRVYRPYRINFIQSKGNYVVHAISSRPLCRSSCRISGPGLSFKTLR